MDTPAIPKLPKLDDHLPATTEAVDVEIAQVRGKISRSHPKSRPMLWAQIDRLLDQRLILEWVKSLEDVVAP